MKIIDIRTPLPGLGIERGPAAVERWRSEQA